MLTLLEDNCHDSYNPLEPTGRIGEQNAYNYQWTVAGKTGSYQRIRASGGAFASAKPCGYRIEQKNSLS